MPIWKSVKQNVSEGENKTLVREKKYHESDLFQIQIMNLINFGPLIFAINSKIPHHGFSESVKYIWNKVKQKVSEGENWR